MCLQIFYILQHFFHFAVVLISLIPAALGVLSLTVGSVDILDKTKKENSSLGGTISWISSTAEFTPKTIQTKEERVTLVYAVKILVPNDGSIKIGMPGEVNF